MNRKRTVKKSITLLTILALLILILPVAVMAKSGGVAPVLPKNASDNARLAHANRQGNPDLVETEEEDEVGQEQEQEKEKEQNGEVEGEKSDRALFVEERNAWAEANNIPAGHVNLFDKLLALLAKDGTEGDPVTRDSLLADYLNEEDPMTVKDIQALIKSARKDQTGEEMEVPSNGNANAAAARSKEKKNRKSN